MPLLSLVGLVPGVGTASDIVVDGTTHRAYVASREFGLSVVNVSTPSAPMVIGASNPPFYGQRVAVAGTLAVGTAGGLGFRFVDLTRPTTPRTVGSLSGTFSGVAFAGTTAYATVAGQSGTDLVVVDLTTPAAPDIVGRVSLGSGGDLRVVGSLAYVAAGGNGLKIVNVTNPNHPIVVGTVALPGLTLGVAVSGTTAYVAGSSTIQVVDVTDPTHPRSIGSLATAAHAVAVAGKRLFAVDGSLFKVIDITTPRTPVLLTSTPGYGAQQLAVAGTAAYLASPNLGGGAGGLSLQNVAASPPTLIANYHDGANDTGVAVVGSLAVTGAGNGGMPVLDLTTPTAPRVAGTFPGFTTAVALAGHTAYAVQLGSSVDLVVVDVATPASPAFVGRLTVGAGGDLKVVGSLVYVASGSYGLKIVDVSTPRRPTLVNTVDTPGLATEVAIANGIAYVADSTSVQVIDVANPNTAAVIGSLATSASAIAVSGTRAYAVDGSQLKIIDITHPVRPVLLNATPGFGAPQGIVVSGTVAYLATPALTHGDVPTGGVSAVDLSDPAHPRLLDQLVVPGTIRKLALDSRFLYASDTASILDVIGR